MSSGRGPGVIGMVMALFVLIGFGLLFMFATDDGFQEGGASIERVIAHQAKDIEFARRVVADGQTALDSSSVRVRNSKELARLTRGNKTLKENIEALGKRNQVGKEEFARQSEAFEAYKNQYRVFVRGKAKGESMATLETLTGGVYKNVSIREVTAVGIQIRHEDGQKRIPFEELPEALKERFQFDPKQKAAVLAKERATWDEHEAAAVVADGLADQEMARQRTVEVENGKVRVRREIEVKQAQIVSIQGEIGSLEREMDRAASQASGARSTGRIHLNKSSSISGDIRSKQGRIATLHAEIARMSSGL